MAPRRRRPCAVAARARSVLLALLLGAPVLSGCAEMGPPPGGPPDTTHPYVLAASPDSMATGVDSTAVIALTFSERVDRQSAREWFFLNPYVPIKDVRWDGPTMRVSFNGPLPSGTTFQFFLGSGVRDRAGLPLAPRFSRLFSTGPTLDAGRVEGRVLRGRKRPGIPGATTPPAPGTAPPTGGAPGTIVTTPAPTSIPRDAVFIWLFPLAGDTIPDPLEETPAWVGEVGSDGRFVLEGVPIHAAYHLMALYDADRSRGPGSSRDYWSFHPDTLRLTGFEPAISGLEVELIDPKSTAEIAGRIAALLDTSVVDSTLLGVVAAPREAAVDSLTMPWPPLSGLQNARAGRDGTFTLRTLKPGIWRVAAFRDRDGDGTWDTGEPLGAAGEWTLRPDDRLIDILLARPPGD